MDMKMALQITGILFIMFGVVFGLTQISSLNEQREDVAYWEKAANEYYDNHLIEERYLMLKNSYESKLVLTLASVISGIISGLFFLALATIINLLQKLVNKESVTTSPSVQVSGIESV